MSVHSTEPWIGSRLRAQPSDTPGLGVAAPIALCALAAILMQTVWLPIDADVSWLITVCEKVLSGARLYVDVVEVNPPASVWLYLPLVWAAHATGAKPEALVGGGFVAAGVISSLCTVRLASKLDDAPRPMFVAFAAGLVTLVFPMALFAQREHAALLLALPALTALALIAEGKRLRLGAAIATGFAAGLVIVIKPHFALAVLPAAIWAAWCCRSLKPLLPGLASAFAALGLYAAAVLLWAEAYFGWVPVLSHVYLPLHDTLWHVLADPLLFPALVLLLALLLRPERLPALVITSALGALGFAAAAMVQAKDYPNHLLPGGGLALFAALTILGSNAPRREKRAISAAIAVVCLWQMQGWAILPDAKVSAAITEVAPPHPRVITLGRELTTGHPVTRNIGARWVGSRAGLYIAGIAHDHDMNDPLAVAAYRRDIRGFAEDVARNSPDVILVDRRDKAWLMQEPQIAQAMRGYMPGKRTGDIEVWVRKPNAE